VAYGETTTARPLGNNTQWVGAEAETIPSTKNIGRGGRWQCHRRVINGILFWQRTGLPRRDLPTRFGKWKTVYDRHHRWSADGTWERVLRAVRTDADVEGRID
jgi:transposase